jgi:23S rRNA (cytosine1962-C5)-methyltransferase
MEINPELFNIIRERIPTDGKTSTRLFHGRGKKIPELDFLCIDYFSPTILITLFKKVPGTFLEALLQEFSTLPLEINSILIQHRYLERVELDVLKGELPQNALAFEFGLQYEIKFGASQNIGFFLDMEIGRKKLLAEASKKRVLNLFSYTCSLSVAALKGGASHVVNVDMSKGALKVGEANHRLNQLDMKQVTFLPYDILASWNNIIKRGPFDLVIIDPPTDQGTSFKAMRDYQKIIKRLDSMTAPGAEIWACLNSPHLSDGFIKDLFSEHVSSFKYLETLYGSFHPMELNPESGLKLVIFTKPLL